MKQDIGREAAYFHTQNNLFTCMWERFIGKQIHKTKANGFLQEKYSDTPIL